MVTSLRSGTMGVALTLCILAGANAQGQQDHPAAGLSVPQSSLTPAEHARAIALAEPSAAISNASALHPDNVSARNSPNRVVVTNVQAVGVDKVNERLAVVTSYQYEGNLTINRLIDLNSGRVVEEDRIQNGGARFTNVEHQYARELLMRDERVRRLIEPLQGRETFNFLLTTTPDPNNPLFGKRVVNVLIATPEGYLTEVPRISINLTDAAVVVGPTP
jgi:Cu2+-containing amine oxidase